MALWALALGGHLRHFHGVHIRVRRVAERDVVGANEVCGRFAGFLAVDVAEGLGHLAWVVSGVMSWQDRGRGGVFTYWGPSFHSL